MVIMFRFVVLFAYTYAGATLLLSIDFIDSTFEGWFFPIHHQTSMPALSQATNVFLNDSINFGKNI